MLLDSNIIIYAAQPEYAWLREWIARQVPAVSAVSYVEVLGYHKLDDDARGALAAFFHAAPVLPLSEPVLDRAVWLRQQRKLSLGDALVAATALRTGSRWSRATSMISVGINGLDLLDPFHERSASE